MDVETAQGGCQVCLTDDRPDELLLCDSCTHSFHLGCLNPALEAVPEGEWYCALCERLGVRARAAEEPGKEDVARGVRRWYDTESGFNMQGQNLAMKVIGEPVKVIGEPKVWRITYGTEPATATEPYHRFHDRAPPKPPFSRITHALVQSTCKT